MKLQSLLKRQQEKKEKIFPPQYPDWVSSSNSSKNAYDAINSIFHNKKEYIARHFKKSDFKTKKHFQIQRSEVAAMIGIKVQPLFNLNNYSKKLENYRTSRNNELFKIFEIKFNPATNPSVKNRKRATLIDELKASKAEVRNLKEKLAREQFNLLVRKLPLDVKKKLKI